MCMTAITLTNGHDYMVMTNGTISNPSLSGTTLTITSTSQFDLIDLGAGTRTGGPSVVIVSASGVTSL